jgi:hemolysin III
MIGRTPADTVPEHAPEVIRSRLRGWFHAGAAPLVLAAGLVLVGLAPSGLARGGGGRLPHVRLLLFATDAGVHAHGGV